MITECKKDDFFDILNVINNAALKYKGYIPDDSWHEPYMTEKELISELNNGVHMFGYKQDEKLIGVMGIQEVQDVTLIRHAYTLTKNQGTGVGKSLLNNLLNKNQSNCFLVGTWKNARWAIQFYKKFGFIIQTKKKTVSLLKKYWKIPLTQMNNSIVLKK